MIEILQSVPCSTAAPLKERLSIIEQLSGQYSVHVLCAALKVSRGTYYNHIFRNLRDNSTYAENRKNLREAIQKTYEENRQIFGANKINALLQERGYITSPKMIAELMRELGISSVSPTAKREYAKWKKGENRNVVQQNFRADKPNRIWVSDVTVFKYKDQYYNICVIIDLFSRKVVAHRVSRNNSTLLVTKTFRQACTLRQPEPGLVFHSDRGAPYVSFAFQKLLHEYQAIQSLSRSGRRTIMPFRSRSSHT